MRGVFWQSNAWEGYIRIQSNQKLLNRLNNLIKDIQRNGYTCSYGKPEMLRGDLAGYASVRIDGKNRLIFQVDDVQVTIIQSGGHYDDK
ncbi:MAG: Txe/YoeB family addiction module toxin [Synergistaceae bacterium]|nr:Txe/YoeB family addiction module toxin [Synergistaceae bacterium]